MLGAMSVAYYVIILNASTSLDFQVAALPIDRVRLVLEIPLVNANELKII